MRVNNRRPYPVAVDDGRMIAGHGVGEVNSRRPRAARLLDRGDLRQVSRAPSTLPPDPVPAGAPPAAAEHAPEQHQTDTEE